MISRYVFSPLDILSGNVYISDCNNRRVRKITISTGLITTIAGSAGTTYAGDGIAATSVVLYYPGSLSLDSSGISPLYHVN